MVYEASESMEQQVRTRIDLDLLDPVHERAAEESRSEEAVCRYLFIPPRDRREEGRRPWPRYPLYNSGNPTLAERVDEELAGGPGSPPFGEH